MHCHRCGKSGASACCAFRRLFSEPLFDGTRYHAPAPRRFSAVLASTGSNQRRRYCPGANCRCLSDHSLKTMCLAIPGKIESISESDSLLRMGKVNFGGIVKSVSLAYVPEANIGDYVIVHVGFALSCVDEDEARKIFDYLKQTEDFSELKEAGP